MWFSIILLCPGCFRPRLAVQAAWLSAAGSFILFYCFRPVCWGCYGMIMLTDCYLPDFQSVTQCLAKGALLASERPCFALWKVAFCGAFCRLLQSRCHVPVFSLVRLQIESCLLPACRCPIGALSFGRRLRLCMCFWLLMSPKCRVHVQAVWFCVCARCGFFLLPFAFFPAVVLPVRRGVHWWCLIPSDCKFLTVEKTADGACWNEFLCFMLTKCKLHLLRGGV